MATADATLCTPVPAADEGSRRIDATRSIETPAIKIHNLGCRATARPSSAKATR